MNAIGKKLGRALEFMKGLCTQRSMKRPVIVSEPQSKRKGTAPPSRETSTASTEVKQAAGNFTALKENRPPRGKPSNMTPQDSEEAKNAENGGDLPPSSAPTNRGTFSNAEQTLLSVRDEAALDIELSKLAEIGAFDEECAGDTTPVAPERATRGGMLKRQDGQRPGALKAPESGANGLRKKEADLDKEFSELFELDDEGLPQEKSPPPLPPRPTTVGTSFKPQTASVEAEAQEEASPKEMYENAVAYGDKRGALADAQFSLESYSKNKLSFLPKNKEIMQRYDNAIKNMTEELKKLEKKPMLRDEAFTEYEREHEIGHFKLQTAEEFQDKLDDLGDLNNHLKAGTTRRDRIAKELPKAKTESHHR